MYSIKFEEFEFEEFEIDEKLLSECIEKKEEVRNTYGFVYIDIFREPGTITLEQGKSKILEFYNDKRRELNRDIYNSKPEINILKNQIKEQEEKLKEKEAKKKKIENIEKEIKSLEDRFYNIFPEKIRDEIRDQKIDSISEFDYIDLLESRTNWFEKIFSKKGYEEKKENISILYNDIKKKKSDLAKEKSKFNNIDEKKIKSEINKLNLRLEREYNAVEYEVRMLYKDLHKQLAAFEDFFYSKERGAIPPTLAWGKLDEPVCFFQQINPFPGEKIEDLKKKIENLLEMRDLPIDKDGSDPNKYFIRCQDYFGTPCLEFITPFYSPETARTNIITLMKYLSKHGIDFRGVVLPVRYYQMNPLVLIKDQEAIENQQHKGYKIKDLLKEVQGEGYTTIEEIEKKYNVRREGGKCISDEYLFRGTSFATADPKSSYGTPTWRVGRMGIPMASDDPKYAASYAALCGPQNNGLTIKEELLPKVEGYNIGVLTVFKRTKKNIMFPNMTLERFSKNRKKLNSNESAEETYINPTETYINPTDNPIVARYFVWKDQYYLINEGDETWHKILDYMAPSLGITHEEHGRGGYHMAMRIKNAKRDIILADLTDEQFRAMGGKTKADKFVAALDNFKSDTAPISMEKTKE